MYALKGTGEKPLHSPEQLRCYFCLLRINNTYKDAYYPDGDLVSTGVRVFVILQLLWLLWSNSSYLSSEDSIQRHRFPSPDDIPLEAADVYGRQRKLQNWPTAGAVAILQRTHGGTGSICPKMYWAKRIASQTFGCRQGEGSLGVVFHWLGVFKRRMCTLKRRQEC